MKFPSLLITFRLACGVAVAAAGLLSTSGAFAQTPASFSFGVENDTFSAGDPVYSVTNDLTFTNLQINETFAGGFAQTIFLSPLTSPAGLFAATPISNYEATPAFSTSAPMTSAILTGSIATFPGQTAQTVLLATDTSGNTTPQYVSSTFSASLFGPAQSGTALGVFSLNSGNNVIQTVNILAPAAVPEASTTVSLGLLLTLGLGALVVSRRRAASAN